MTKLSVVVPVYFNEDTLENMYSDLMEHGINPLVDKYKISYEIVLVNDGSKDSSWEVISKLAKKDLNVRGISLSKNFGAHNAITAGLVNSSGDCIAVKAADLQEPSSVVFDMFESWQKGNNTVLAVRSSRNDGAASNTFANLFYWLTKKVALKNMPDGGFDVFLIDRKVAKVIENLSEVNSPLPMQILWSGFTTSLVPYVRLQREVGKSRWTLKKKIKFVSDMLFSFSTVPITLLSTIGVVSLLTGSIWTIIIIAQRLSGVIQTIGWTAMFAVQLITFGVTMLSISILGGYLWRTFESSKNRPQFIIEKETEK